jgi:hypothetical protein
LLVDDPPEEELPDELLDDELSELPEDDDPLLEAEEEVSPEDFAADAPAFSFGESFEDSLAESLDEPVSPDDPDPERLSLR